MISVFGSTNLHRFVKAWIGEKEKKIIGI